MPHSRGVLVGSDFTDKPATDPLFAVYKQCGFWTVNEAKILFAVAQQIGGYWMEIGGLTGWTAAHLAVAGCHVVSLDPMYANPEFRSRAVENLTACGQQHKVGLWPVTSHELFSRSTRLWSGIMIDGDHVAPSPMRDAIAASKRLVSGGVILFHDAFKPPVQEAYKHLENSGWTVRLFSTSQGVALCHQAKDGFVLPEALR